MSERVELEIREPARDDIPDLVTLVRTAFNVSADWSDRYEERFRPERMLVAADGGRAVASGTVIPMQQWFGGRPLSMAGVAGVAVSPTYRGTGVASSILQRLLGRAREQGSSISSLFPATVPVYRKLGYEYAGTYTSYRMPLSALPDIPRDAARVIDAGEDPAPLMRSYRRLAGQENGFGEGLGDEWWPKRVMGGWAREAHGAVMTEEDTPDGYATYIQQALTPGEWGYRLVCTHLIAHTPAAFLSLMAHFRRFKGLAQELEWHGPPVEPLAMLLPEQSLKPEWDFRFMSRILDVAAALEGRGYPPGVTGEVRFTVRDPLFPDNDGSFVLEAQDGAVGVTKEAKATGDGPELSIGAFSALFSGYLTPAAAARVGLVPEPGPGLDLLGRLFAGPPPWTTDFF